MVEIELFRERVRRNLAYVVMAALIAVSAAVITGFQQPRDDGAPVSDTMKGLVIGNLFTLSGLVVAFYFKGIADRTEQADDKLQNEPTTGKEDT